MRERPNLDPAKSATHHRTWTNEHHEADRLTATWGKKGFMKETKDPRPVSPNKPAIHKATPRGRRRATPASLVDKPRLGGEPRATSTVSEGENDSVYLLADVRTRRPSVCHATQRSATQSCSAMLEGMCAVHATLRVTATVNHAHDPGATNRMTYLARAPAPWRTGRSACDRHHSTQDVDAVISVWTMGYASVSARLANHRLTTVRTGHLPRPPTNLKIPVQTPAHTR